jgi:sarcosine oxidase subunit beta
VVIVLNRQPFVEAAIEKGEADEKAGSGWGSGSGCGPGASSLSPQPMRAVIAETHPSPSPRPAFRPLHLHSFTLHSAQTRYDAPMQTAEIVIIGAGIIGSSIAWHLAARGCHDILVLDRATELGCGSTGRATGGFRTQFGSEINVRLSLLARGKLRRFEEEIGVDAGYRPCGYLFLARSQDTLDELCKAQGIQHACGVTEARMIDADEARALNPAIEDDTLLGGAFCPTDGFIRPMDMLRGYVAAAERLGVRFQLGVNVRPHDLTVRAGVIVNATGAWAGGFGVPVTPLRRNVAATVPTHHLPESMPMTIWADDGYHLRMRDGRALLLWPDDPVIDDEQWFARIARFTRERVPPLRDVAIDRASSWSGLYEMSPDRHAIVGRVEGRVILANGSSGHGVMHAPAIGQLVAEIILDGQATTLDIEPLRPSRFAEGKPIASPMLL